MTRPDVNRPAATAERAVSRGARARPRDARGVSERSCRAIPPCKASWSVCWRRTGTPGRSEAPVGTPAGVRRLSPGASVGGVLHHQFIGAGGMGDIYRARDARLGRDIAIKILPASAAADAERRTRFAREASAIAALNHPNIVTIHSVEKRRCPVPHDGARRRKTLRSSSPLAESRSIGCSRSRSRSADAIGTAHQHGHHPSRPEAGECDGHHRWPREGARLWPCETARGRARTPPA